MVPYVPAGQGYCVLLLVPSGQKKPCGQGAPSPRAEALPSTSAKRPAATGYCVRLVAPAAVQYPGAASPLQAGVVRPGAPPHVPAGQGVGAVEFAPHHVPRGHGGRGWSAPAAHTAPAGQAPHCADEERPANPPSVPAGHGCGVALPLTQKDARGQAAAVAVVDPSELHRLPGAHGLHAAARPAEYVPGAHRTGKVAPDAQAAPGGQGVAVLVLPCGQR